MRLAEKIENRSPLLAVMSINQISDRIKSLNSFFTRLTANQDLCDKVFHAFFDIHRRGDLRQLAPRKKLLKSREVNQSNS